MLEHTLSGLSSEKIHTTPPNASKSVLSDAWILLGLHGKASSASLANPTDSAHQRCNVWARLGGAAPTPQQAAAIARNKDARDASANTWARFSKG